MIRHEGILTHMQNEVESAQRNQCSQQNILVPQ